MEIFYICVISLGFLILLLVIGYMTQGAFYAPSADSEIEDIKTLLKKRKRLKIIDLGSGDGRIVAALAELNHDVTGIEFNSLLYRRSLRKRHGKYRNNMHFINGNMWKHDLREYDVVVVYGIPHIMDRLEKKIRLETKPGTLILSNDFFLPNAEIVNALGRIHVFTYRKSVSN